MVLISIIYILETRSVALFWLSLSLDWTHTLRKPWNDRTSPTFCDSIEHFTCHIVSETQQTDIECWQTWIYRGTPIFEAWQTEVDHAHMKHDKRKFKKLSSGVCRGQNMRQYCILWYSHQTWHKCCFWWII